MNLDLGLPSPTPKGRSVPERLHMALDPLMAALPIAALVWMMTKRRALPSWQALPLSATGLYLVKILYFGEGANDLNAAAISGLLLAWTPIMISWGATMLFLSMEASGCMDSIRDWLRGISEDKTAQLMLIGWAFVFLIEGASGFGTPAALAAPLLVGLGFKPVRAAIFCLMTNSISVPFGAAGVPTWFGLSACGLVGNQMQQTAFESSLVQFAAALLITPLGAGMVLGSAEAKRKLPFIFLSTLSCTVPFLILARFNYEFPSLLGGGIGLALTAFMARHGVGLGGERTRNRSLFGTLRASTVAAFFPLWGCVALLLLTRIDLFGLKRLLNNAEPLFSISLPALGSFHASPALVLGLDGILGTAESWSQKTLYIPGIIPFVAISLLTVAIIGKSKGKAGGVLLESAGRVKMAALALFGAMVLVKLLMEGGESSCAMKIGGAFASVAGSGWIYCAPFLGAMGSFFAGSSTVSNLTFAGIQHSIAEKLSLEPTVVVALQSAGSSMGTMASINNIVAVSTVLGISLRRSGLILKATLKPLLLYGLVAALAGRALLSLRHLIY